jgi:hypothetical protein
VDRAPHRVIAAVQRGMQALESLHYVGHGGTPSGCEIAPIFYRE